MKKKVLIVSQSQFGYLIDYVQYCKYLKKDFKITYLGWDYGKRKCIEEGIRIQYVSRKGNLVARNLRFIKSVLLAIRENNFSHVFIGYFRGCSLIPLFSKKSQKIHLDIRTGYISENVLKRNFYNGLLRFESLFYESVSVISSSLLEYLKIKSDASILPLGADRMDVTPNVRHKISLLYVGILSDRGMEDTIEGLAIFLRKNPDADIIYTIIGDGWKNELEIFERKIRDYKLEKHIFLKGYIQKNELKPYFEMANVGVAYIPVTSYYDCQPATKVFEYLMAGLPVIATGTYENRQIIKEDNGVIIDSTPESFSKGIKYIYNRIEAYDNVHIKGMMGENEWEKIVYKMKNEIMKFN